MIQDALRWTVADPCLAALAWQCNAQRRARQRLATTFVEARNMAMSWGPHWGPAVCLMRPTHYPICSGMDSSIAAAVEEMPSGP